MAENMLKKAIENAVKAEELGVAFYAELAKKFEKISELKDTFNLLAKDEVEHKKQFEEILATVNADEVHLSALDSEFLDGIDISKYFSEMGSIDTNLTPGQVLERAFFFEKETVLYYTIIRDIVGDSPQLTKIINIEKGHALKLMKIITSDAKFRGISDRWDNF